MLLLSHDCASSQATHHCYDLFTRNVIPYLKGQLKVSQSSHDLAKGKHDQLMGCVDGSIVKAITEHLESETN